MFQSPQKPKGDCDLIKYFSIFQSPNWFQSPQKPKGDCDQIGYKWNYVCYCKFQSPQKPKGDCDDYIVIIFIFYTFSSNHPKSRKAIVTLEKGEVLDFGDCVPITPKAERRL